MNPGCCKKNRKLIYVHENYLQRLVVKREKQLGVKKRIHDDVKRDYGKKKYIHGHETQTRTVIRERFKLMESE